jgi:hypothetical protein
MLEVSRICKNLHKKFSVETEQYAIRVWLLAIEFCRTVCVAYKQHMTKVNTLQLVDRQRCPSEEFQPRLSKGTVHVPLETLKWRGRLSVSGRPIEAESNVTRGRNASVHKATSIS